MIFRKSLLTLACGVLLQGVALAQHVPEASDSTEAAPSTARLFYDAVKARMMGDDKESEILFKRVVKEQPDDAAAYYDLSRLALKRNDGQGALDYIKKAIELDGTNKWYREQYASVLTLRNDYLAAAKEYAELAKTERYNEQYLEKSALLYQRAGKLKEALAQLEELHRKNPDGEGVLLQQQELYLKMNDVAGAARTVRELMAANPKEARYYNLLIEIYSNNKQPDKAKEVLEEMNRKFPSDPSLQIAQADAALKNGDTAAYRNYIKMAVVNKGLDASTQIGLLQGFVRELSAGRNRLIEALQLTEEIARQHPDDVGVLSFYAYLLGQDGQKEAAASQLKRAVTLRKSDFSLWEQLLYTYADRNSADSLIKWSEKAARLFPNQAEVHYLNGVAHNFKKDYPPAIEAIRRAIDLSPDDKADELSNMYTTLGDIYNSLKQFKSSDSSYDAALTYDPENATVLNNYAYYLSERNTRLTDAARMSEKSLKIRPGEATFLDTYGWILYQQGKYRDALTYIQKAIDGTKDNSDPSLYEHLGAVQYKLGNKDAAVEAWQKAKAKGSENKEIDRMIAERKLYE